MRKEWPVLDSDPEAIKNMARGIIVRSIRDFVRYKNKKRPKYKKLYNESYSWIFLEEPGDSDDPYDKLMSFEGICGILGWSPSWLRERVKTLTVADLDRLGRNGHKTGLNS